VEPGQGRGAGEILARDRFETDRGGFDAERIGPITHALQQRAMALVDAIESTDTDNTASRRQGSAQAIATKPEHPASIAAGRPSRARRHQGPRRWRRRNPLASRTATKLTAPAPTRPPRRPTRTPAAAVSQSGQNCRPA